MQHWITSIFEVFGKILASAADKVKTRSRHSYVEVSRPQLSTLINIIKVPNTFLIREPMTSRPYLVY